MWYSYSGYLDGVKLGISLLGERAYIGKVKIEGKVCRFVGIKKDVTSDFIKAIIDYIGDGYSRTIDSSTGESYKITCEKVKK